MNLPGLEASLIIAALIAAFAIFSFLKGIIRIIALAISLAVAGIITWIVCGYVQEFFGVDSYAPLALSITVGLFFVYALQRIIKHLLNPFKKNKSNNKKGLKLFSAAISVIIGLSTLWLGCVGIRYAGSIAELNDLHRNISNSSSKKRDLIAIMFKDILEDTDIGKWHRANDSFNSSADLALAKVLILYHNDTAKKVMLQDRQMNPILNNRLFLEVAFLDGIKRSIKTGAMMNLYNNEYLEKATADPTYNKELLAIDFGDK